MPRRLAVLAFLLACAIVVFTPLAQAAGSVQTAAHLIVSPAPPYVRAQWTASPGTTAAIVESTWIVRVNCSSGAFIASLGLRQIGSSGNAGPRTMRSNPVQVLAGDCLVPAGNLTRNGAVLASSVGPTYRW